MVLLLPFARAGGTRHGKPPYLGPLRVDVWSPQGCPAWWREHPRRASGIGHLPLREREHLPFDDLLSAAGGAEHTQTGLQINDYGVSARLSGGAGGFRRPPFRQLMSSRRARTGEDVRRFLPEAARQWPPC